MLILGHRGCAYYPENTLRSFEEALNFADGIELDVQKTKDGVLVISHDSNLKRLTGLDIDIRSRPFSEIKDIKIQGEKIATLEEALELVKGKRKFVDIEVKNPLDFEDVYKVLKKINLKDYIISSFWHEGLFSLKKKDPNVKIAFLYVHQPRLSELKAYIKDSDFLKPNFQYIDEIYEGYFSKLISWTVNDEGRAKYFQKIGIFALITDFPDKIFQSLKEGKDMFFSNPYLSYFIQMIDRTSVKKEDNSFSFEAINYIMPLHIEEINIEGGKIELSKSIPFEWTQGERIKFNIEVTSENPKIKIRVREVGEVVFTLKDIQRSLV